jgi:hypothetical protein
MDYLKDARSKVTIEMLESLNYGQELPLNSKYCLYKYTSEDLIVLNETEEWEELYTVLYDKESNEIIFEE